MKFLSNLLLIVCITTLSFHHIKAQTNISSLIEEINQALDIPNKDLAFQKLQILAELAFNQEDSLKFYEAEIIALRYKMDSVFQNIEVEAAEEKIAVSPVIYLDSIRSQNQEYFIQRYGEPNSSEQVELSHISSSCQKFTYIFEEFELSITFIDDKANRILIKPNRTTFVPFEMQNISYLGLELKPPSSFSDGAKTLPFRWEDNIYIEYATIHMMPFATRKVSSGGSGTKRRVRFVPDGSISYFFVQVSKE